MIKYGTMHFIIWQAAALFIATTYFRLRPDGILYICYRLVADPILGWRFISASLRESRCNLRKLKCEFETNVCLPSSSLFADVQMHMEGLCPHLCQRGRHGDPHQEYPFRVS